MEANLKQTDFESHVSETYQVNLGSDESFALRLEEVTPRQAHAVTYECFSILFSGPRGRLLEQQIHELTHEQLGTFSLLLVPVATEDTQQYYYEAVFNRQRAEP